MKRNVATGSIPIIDTHQLRTELHEGGVPVAELTANAHHSFHINRVEDYFRMVSFPLQSDLQPRRMTVYNFFFLTKGISSRSSGLNTYDFGENTFFFVPAHQITTHKFARNVEGYYCHFTLDLLVQRANPKELSAEFPFLEYNGYPLVLINDASRPYVTALLERLLVEYRADKAARFDILRAYLLTLFTELKPFVEASRPVSADAASQITEQYKKALEKSIYQNQKVADYAEMLSVSPNHLNKCVKKAAGKSAHDLLNEMLLLEAKVLLKQTDLTITEIAYKVGRNETSDFARFFKAQTGMKPSEYRLFT